MKPLRRVEQPSVAPVEFEPAREDAEASEAVVGVAASERAPVDATVLITPAAPVQVPTPTEKTEIRQSIEAILSEGLGEVYQAMPPDAQAAFKKRGEDVAGQVEQWMQQATLVARKVLRIVRDWLRMIPRVNRHFLEQESKRKVDRLLRLKEEDL